MPGDVAGQLSSRSIPAAVTAVGLVGKPGPETQIIEHPVGFQIEQIFGVQFLRVLERSVCQAHGGEWKRLRRKGGCLKALPDVFEIRGIGSSRDGIGLRLMGATSQDRNRQRKAKSF